LTEQPIRRGEWFAVLGCCIAAAIISSVWSWQHDALLNYGDAVAHLHIARRVIDSHRPGFSQLGSVWLPLPHLLLIPFVAVFAWWANGLAGLFASSLAWFAACVGIYRLARIWLKPLPAGLTLAFFVTNPNLLYLQTTAMTEPLFLCEMIWASLLLVKWQICLDSEGTQRSGRQLYWIALVLAAAVFTRYDGWVLALLVWIVVAWVLARRGGLPSSQFWFAGILVAAAPAIWFSYNGVVFGDWLDFLRGPYSAKAIELRTALPGGPPHPGWHNPWESLLFYVKVGEMDAVASGWGNTLLVFSALATAWACWLQRRKAFLWALFLWLPVPFYAYSVAYGSVPIFIPPWWPHSWYNTRYGVELLPALALGLGFVAQFVVAVVGDFKPVWTKYAATTMFVLIAINAAWILRERPLVYVEGTKNLESRRAYEVEIPPILRALVASRPGRPVLMNTSVYPQIVAFSGIPLRQTINESDREFYQAALASPADHAAVIVAFKDDDVDKAVRAHPEGLKVVQHFVAKDLPPATIYVSDTPAAP
jgi:hypothetical protein